MTRGLTLKEAAQKNTTTCSINASVDLCVHPLSAGLPKQSHLVACRVDPLIPAEYQTPPDDYDEPVYEQGHLASSESIDGSPNAWMKPSS